MRANRRRDTAPERRIRSLLHRRGLRFRVDYRVGQERGSARPDIAFTRLKLAVFIDGCFWHGCPEHGRVPATNSAYWAPKLARNAERDRENDDLLRASGWRVLRLWEHTEPHAAADEIAAAAEWAPGR
jgi:DNA mismatch endonuclease (patch repair protein)